ncbi:uncharacterized protein LOC109850722 isoform X3 [Asparagus officinalis]|uniref:uncharacterized protein LOC109850722 isoform X3 n=1 Tax=Asparagus officinalis TaxID=4686 RepID=UPI00098E50C0|nr:uncharacterized protein LOC109850722 isoform X3 [Asparagus officinalis]
MTDPYAAKSVWRHWRRRSSVGGVPANSHYFVIIEQESTCQEYFTNEAESSKKKVHLDNVSLSVTCDNTEVKICSSDNITPCKRNLFESDVEQSVSVDLISPQMSSNKKEKLIKIEKDNY